MSKNKESDIQEEEEILDLNREVTIEGLKQERIEGKGDSADLGCSNQAHLKKQLSAT